MARRVGGCPPELAPLLATTPAPEIAKRAGVSANTVYAWKRRAGVTPFPSGRPRSRMSPANTCRAIDALRATANAPSDRALARHFGGWRAGLGAARHNGVSPAVLHRWEEWVNAVGAMPSPAPRYNADEVWDIIEGLRATLRKPPLTALARQLGVARHTVANARQFGAPVALVDTWRNIVKGGT